VSDSACQKAFPLYHMDSTAPRKASADKGQATPQTASDCDSLGNRLHQDAKVTVLYCTVARIKLIS
jgi:hypothetical protein